MLCTAFEGAMDMLQNNAMVQKSHKAIEQAEGVAKLTRLAFFFIPLSLTASIFGMNVRQFSPDVSLSVWVWVITSVVTLVLFYLVLTWGDFRLSEQVKHLKTRRTKRELKDNEALSLETLIT